MTFAIITHTTHVQKDGQLYAYGPYVKEMDLWGKHTDRFLICAPQSKNGLPPLATAYAKENSRWMLLPSISFTSFSETIRAVWLLPVLCYRIFKLMRQADHIHLRCPGNIGLLGCLMQLFFPMKPKTAKYAGNWDPKAKQPWSYRFQKWILSNTLFTHNITVLVYGNWPGQSKNIRSFFTASYTETDKEPVEKSLSEPYRFVFAGSLSPGKQPLYAVQLVEVLQQEGISCTLDIYGDGAERDRILDYLIKKNLTGSIVLRGNQSFEVLTRALKSSHFLILPSRSEGWPKALAEAMWWGVVPVATRVSCVPWMLDEGKRGVLLTNSLASDAARITEVIRNPERMQQMADEARQWSRQYTLDYFEAEIKKLL